MWIELARAVIMLIISYAISASMQPKQEKPQAGSLDIPEPNEGDAITVVFGEVLKKDANVIWYGDASTKEIKTKGGKK